MTQYLQILPSGRIYDRSILSEHALQIQAEDYPEIIYMSVEKENNK